MVIQYINIKFKDVFKSYSEKYKIFRDLLEFDSIAVEIRDVNFKLAEAAKKLILSKKEICYLKQNNSDNFDILLFGNYSALVEISHMIKANEDEGLGLKIQNLLNNYSHYDDISFHLDSKILKLDYPIIMGILNVTPDSFSDGGKFFNPEMALRHAEEMIAAGVDIIDIGGESTRPGSDSISADEELNRVIPVIQDIKQNHPNSIISIDTTKSIVAEAALENGALIVNDISGFDFDDNMPGVVKKYNAAVILMHTLDLPKIMQNNPNYEDVVNQVYNDLSNKINKALKAGIKNIVVDPGIGFGKTVSNNFDLIRRLDEFKGLGFPILVGVSRKSFLGKSLNLDVTNREESTLISETIAVQNGANIIRTHNFRNALQLKKLTSFYSNPQKVINV